MQGELKQLSAASIVRFGSELFFYLRNMLFGLARSLAHCTHCG